MESLCLSDRIACNFSASIAHKSIYPSKTRRLCLNTADNLCFRTALRPLSIVHSKASNGSLNFKLKSASEQSQNSGLQSTFEKKDSNPIETDAVSVIDLEPPQLLEVIDENVKDTALSFSEIGEFFSRGRSSALATMIFWVSAAVLFGAGIAIFEGGTKASEYFAGYLLEQSLSVDNLFVFVLIFEYFQVPVQFQGKVLSYGISGAVVFRAIMIILGVASIQRFESINLLFAGILLFSSYKLLTETGEDEKEDLSNNFIVKTCQNLIPCSSVYDGDKFYTLVDGVKKATPLLLTLVVVELSDIAFAVDSIPAVFGVTRDPFIVLTSNIFAILGLRSLYTLISGSMKELHYLQPSIAVVLGFIGSKMVTDFVGFHLPTETSLGVVAGVLATGIFLSLKFPKKD